MTSVSRFLGVFIEGDTELEELCKKTPDSVWSKLANKLVPYVLDQGALERIVFLTGFTKLKTYTSDNIIPLLKNYTGEKAAFHFAGGIHTVINRTETHTNTCKYIS